MFSVQNREERWSHVWGYIQTSVVRTSGMLVYSLFSDMWVRHTEQATKPHILKIYSSILAVKENTFPLQGYWRENPWQEHQKVSSASSAQREGIRWGAKMAVQTKGADTQEGQARDGGVSLLPQLLPQTLLAHSHATRASTLAGKAELLSCRDAGFWSKAQILHFRVELCANTPSKFLACH